MKRSWTDWVFRAYLLIALAFVFAPAFSLVLFSFHEGKVQSFPIESYSTKWYLEGWENRELREGLANSLKVGFSVGLLSTTLGFLSAHLLSRRRPRRELLYIALVTLPALVPLILSGMALVMYFQQIRLAGTLWAIIVAHTCYASPFAFALIRNPYSRLNIELEQAARNLGAGSLQVIFQIVVPQLWPALAGAALLSFLVSWDEFIMAWFVGGFARTLPVVIYGMMGGAFNPTLNAVGTVMMSISIILLGGVFLLQSTIQRRIRGA